MQPPCTPSPRLSAAWARRQRIMGTGWACHSRCWPTGCTPRWHLCGWVGLFYMALVLFPAFRLAGFSAEERRAFLAKAVPRFSRLAILSVVALAVTGTYSVLTHSNDLGTILSTEYGIVLAVEVAGLRACWWP